MPSDQGDLLQEQLASTSTSPSSDPELDEASEGPSVSVKLQETDQAGQYLLTAEDAKLLQEVLHHKSHLESTGGLDAERRRFRFQDLEFTRQLSTFDRQNPSLYLNKFHGFFTLFWLGVTLLLVKIAANNWRIYGSLWGQNEIIHLMFRKDVLVLGISDLVLCWSTVFCLGLQRAVLRGYIRWSGLGWLIQNTWQTAYLAIAIWWTYHRDWPWTHTVFMVLHCLTMLMKQHSYSSFNGYLSELYRKRDLLRIRLRRLNKHSDEQGCSSSRTSARDSGGPVDPAGPNQIKNRHSINHQSSVNHQSFRRSSATDHLLALSGRIDSGTPLGSEQMASLKALIEREIELLSDGLRGQFSSTNQYPRNLSMGNFCDFVTLPTLVYELEYPRTERVNWVYVAEKTAATFGIIVVMIAISQNWIYPVVMSTLQMKEKGFTLQQRLQEFPWVLSDLLFPFMMEYLLAFYVIWECVLNAVAEITRFADRGFYADWWNSVSWDQFARDWNRPVHNFLLRHVYHSSISTFHLSRVSASLITFLLSACVHELIMLCIFRRLRGYLLILQMSQLPLVSLSRTRLMRGRRLVGNVFFWLGIFTGPSLLCSLYLII
ncbi:hypothetical protein N7507_006718 [Penicillium longicatenatum]|nr:hypothetical protein N7507_006718 [Penicillium longicatenatum]